MKEEKQNTDNLLEDNNPGIEADVVTDSEQDADDFFASLDKEVNSGAYDDNTSELEKGVTQQKTTEEYPVEEMGSEEVARLQKRYSDSSREAKRLNSRLKDLEPYTPLLDAFRTNPDLIQYVRNYFEGGGQTPKSVKERLGLGEEFVYDVDEAITSPDSDSAKVFNAVVDEAVSKKLSKHQKEQEVVTQRRTEEAQFINKHKLSKEDYADVVAFAKDKTLTLDDILYLKTRQDREKQVAGAAREEMLSQMKNVRQKPASLSSTGSRPTVNKTQEDNLFDAILGLDSELDNAFG